MAHTVAVLLHREVEVAPINIATLYAISSRPTQIQNTCSKAHQYVQV
jgi:hypothetical protein